MKTLIYILKFPFRVFVSLYYILAIPFYWISGLYPTKSMSEIVSVVFDAIKYMFKTKEL